MTSRPSPRPGSADKHRDLPLRGYLRLGLLAAIVKLADELAELRTDGVNAALMPIEAVARTFLAVY